MHHLTDDNKLIYMLGSEDFKDTYTLHMADNMDGCYNVVEYIVPTDAENMNFEYLENIISYHMHCSNDVSPYNVNDEKFVLLLTYDIKFHHTSSPIKHGFEVVGTGGSRMFIMFDTKEEYEYQFEIIQTYLKKPFDIQNQVG